MGATLWHGAVTAQRYALPCPRCSSVATRCPTLAAVDSDPMGRTLVLCGGCGSFVMPLTVGGRGSAWPVDVAGLDREPEDFVPRSATARRCAGFGGASCHRAVGPRSLRCSSCAKLAAAEVLECTEPGCTNPRSAKAERCQTCAHARILERMAARRRRVGANKTRHIEQNPHTEQKAAV